MRLSALNRLLPVSILAIVLSLASVRAMATQNLEHSPFAETWYVEGPLAPETFQAWKQAAGAPALRWNLKDAYPSEIEQVPAFPAQRKVQILLGEFPNEVLIPALSRLAQGSTEAVLLTGTFPSLAEIDRLNRIPFKKLLLVAAHFPDPDLGQALQALRSPVEIVFAVRAYPRFVDRPNLLSIPATIPLSFSTDYWPWYSQMDLLNLLPHPIRLRVKDSFPAAESLPYLHNIRRLESLTVELQSPAPRSAWQAFKDKPVRWIALGRVPTRDELREFMDSAPTSKLRSLTVDSDLELTPEERKRLESLPIPVEWTHAPLTYSQRRALP